MVVFLDTSALAKRYILEFGYRIVDSYFDEDNLVKKSIEIICNVSLKSLDSIQLASASLSEIEEFVTAYTLL